MGRLLAPALVVQIPSTDKGRVAAFIKKNAPGLRLLGDVPRAKKEEAFLIFGSPTPKTGEPQPAASSSGGAVAAAASADAAAATAGAAGGAEGTWDCHFCTFKNWDQSALICAMCDSPRSVQDWAGFNKPKAGTPPTALSAHTYKSIVQACRAMARSEHVGRTFEKGSARTVTHDSNSLEDLVAAFEEICVAPSPEPKRVRLRCKSDVRQALIGAHLNEHPDGIESCMLVKDNHTHVFTAMRVDERDWDGVPNDEAGVTGSDEGLFLYGLIEKAHDYASIADNNKPEPSAQSNVNQVCRASHKLKELVTVSQLMIDKFATQTEDAPLTALDIGASPGGWTEFLADRCKGKVVAVDTGALHPDILARENVVHLKTLLLDKERDGAAFSNAEDTAAAQATPESYTDTLAAIASSTDKAVDIVCCDINMNPREAVEITLRSVPVLAENALVTVTMKLSSRAEDKKAMYIAEAKEVMSKHCADIEEHWLFANTFMERTLVGRYTGPSTFVPQNVVFKPSTADTKFRDAVARIKQLAANRQSRLYIVMENPENFWNAAAASRSCDAFGVTTMLFVLEATGDFAPSSKKYINSSSSANQWVDAETFKSVQAATAFLKARHGDEPIHHYATTGHCPTSVSLYEADFVGAKEPAGASAPCPVVVVWFGNERHGLSEEAVKLAQTAVHIPMRGMVESINLSVSVGIVLGEITRQRIASGKGFTFTEAEQAALVEQLMVTHSVKKPE